MLLPCIAVGALLGAVAEAPVTAVTVYSDRARVTRTAKVSAAGAAEVTLPLLPETVDTSSIRVEATGVEVRRVDIAPVPPDEVPTGEARALLAALEKVDDQVAQTSAERDAHSAQLEQLRRLSPEVPPNTGERPPPRIAAGAWPTAGAVVADQTARLQARLRELNDRLFDLARQRERLVNEARLLGGAERRGGIRVVATLGGTGAGQLALTYMMPRARWVPTYEVQLQPERARVQLSFAALVSQETGEDWEDAVLTLSTAVPGSATAYPTLLTWKIGEQERFIPTPVARPEPVVPPPPSPPLPVAESEGEVLLRRLLAKAAVPDQRVRRELGAPPGVAPGADYQNRAGQALQDDYSEAPEQAEVEEAYPPEPAPRAAASMPGRAAAAPSAVTRSPPSMRMAKQRPPPSPPGASLAPPPAYVPPTFGPDLPASAAGGYDLAFASLRPETLRSGKGARRVPLFAEEWPVQVERKLFPALDPEAFLVAELKNPSARVLPAGQASLYVGTDPAGTARLSLMAPDEKVTLPLGRDRALRPLRNVKVTSGERGLFAKDELTHYEVTLELANPYPVKVPIRLFDQVPVTDDPDVKLELLKMEPLAIQDKVSGSLEWRLDLPASGKVKVSFTYSLRRPKGYRLRQAHGGGR